MSQKETKNYVQVGYEKQQENLVENKKSELSKDNQLGCFIHPNCKK